MHQALTAFSSVLRLICDDATPGGATMCRHTLNGVDSIQKGLRDKREPYATRIVCSRQHALIKTASKDYNMRY